MTRELMSGGMMTRELKVRRVLIVRAGESNLCQSSTHCFCQARRLLHRVPSSGRRARWPRLGRVMSELEASTRVKIKVRDPNGRTGAGQKSVDVSGCGGARLRAHPIEELLAAEVVRLNSEDGHHTVTLRVPVNLVGGVMGQRGERIMHIEKLCGAKVDLSKRFENDMREIRVSSGDAGAVERAVEK